MIFCALRPFSLVYKLQTCIENPNFMRFIAEQDSYFQNSNRVHRTVGHRQARRVEILRLKLTLQKVVLG